MGASPICRRARLTGKLAAETIDVTLPGRTPLIGTVHPVSQMIDEVSEIFAYLGFETVFGPEVETGRYNFDMLNIPADHPARDVWDTIIVDDERDEIVLRTHTSPMQARVMEQRTAPVRVIVPGRVYRYEAQDASHEWMFHQTRRTGGRRPDHDGRSEGHVDRARAAALRSRTRGSGSAAISSRSSSRASSSRSTAPSAAATVAASASNPVGSRWAAPAWSTRTCCAGSATTRTRYRAWHSASASSGW